MMLKYYQDLSIFLLWKNIGSMSIVGVEQKEETNQEGARCKIAREEQKHQLGPKRTWLVLSFALSFRCEEKQNA